MNCVELLVQSLLLDSLGPGLAIRVQRPLVKLEAGVEVNRFAASTRLHPELVAVVTSESDVYLPRAGNESTFLKEARRIVRMLVVLVSERRHGQSIPLIHQCVHALLTGHHTFLVVLLSAFRIGLVHLPHAVWRVVHRLALQRLMRRCEMMPLEVHFLLLRPIVDPGQTRLPGRLLRDFVASPQRRFPILLSVMLRLEVLAAERRIHRHVVVLWLGAGDVRPGWWELL